MVDDSPEAGSDPDADPDARPDPDADPDARPDPDTGPENGVDADRERGPDPGTESDADAGSSVDRGPDVDLDPDEDVDLEPDVAVRLVTGIARIEDLAAFLADLERVGDEFGCTLQAFDARYVAGPGHLRRAVALADRAIRRGENVARERAVEVLVYAAGRRQIDDALAMGIGEGETPLAVVVAADPAAGDGSDGAAGGADVAGAARAVADLSAVEEGPVEFGDPGRLRDFFGIGERELAASGADLGALVLERVALLEVEK